MAVYRLATFSPTHWGWFCHAMILSSPDTLTSHPVPFGQCLQYKCQGDQGVVTGPSCSLQNINNFRAILQHVQGGLQGRASSHRNRNRDRNRKVTRNRFRSRFRFRYRFRAPVVREQICPGSCYNGGTGILRDSITCMVVPCPGVVSTVREPPCSSTSLLTTASPRPAPSCLRV